MDATTTVTEAELPWVIEARNGVELAYLGTSWKGTHLFRVTAQEETGPVVYFSGPGEREAWEAYGKLLAAR